MRRKKRRTVNPLKPIFPPSRREQKRAEYRKERPTVRKRVWEDAGGLCFWPTCGRYVTLDAMHAHEIVFRSQGGSAIEDENVVCSCGKCHMEIHRRLGGILKRVSGYADGTRHYFERKTGKDPWVEVFAGEAPVSEREPRASVAVQKAYLDVEGRTNR